MSSTTDKYIEWNLITDLKIRPSDGRIKLREPSYDRHGIEPGDDIMVELTTDDGRDVYLGRVTVQKRWRFSVPSDIVEANDIRGEYVDMRFRFVDTQD